MLFILKIKFDLRMSLSRYRYKHCIRVAKEAKKMARYYGVNEDDAYLAGLLHDIAKEYGDDKNRYWIYKYNLSEELLKNNWLCHSMVGEVVARELYSVSNEVASAIKYHTIGNINMNMLDKIVFVADKIELGKNYPGIDEERYLAYKDIDEAMVKCIKNNKLMLAKNGKALHKDTEELLIVLEDRIKN